MKMSRSKSYLTIFPNTEVVNPKIEEGKVLCAKCGQPLNQYEGEFKAMQKTHLVFRCHNSKCQYQQFDYWISRTELEKQKVQFT